MSIRRALAATMPSRLFATPRRLFHATISFVARRYRLRAIRPASRYYAPSRATRAT